MRLVTALQMRECDRRTIAGEHQAAPIPGQVLMERAAAGIYAALRRRFAHLGQRAILVFCGSGNNGGDGLAVARRLHEDGYAPRVLLLAERARLSADAAEQHRRYVARGGCCDEVADEARLGACVSSALRAATRYPPLLVDALLGTGARGVPRGLTGAGVSLINTLRDGLGAEVLSVDLPTGVDADTGAVAGEAVNADLTVTMAYLKLGFLFHPARSRLGRVQVVDIGIPDEVGADVGLPYQLITQAAAAALVPHRAPAAHKAQVGRILVIGGSPGLSGAPAMAALAALRSGAGLVTVAIPESLAPALAAKLTEVMTLGCPASPSGCHALASEDRLSAMEDRIDVWALGPGIGREDGVVRLVRRLVHRLPGPMVVDADGLFALAGESWRRPAGSPAPILTPHAGEMARLLGVTAAQVMSAPVEIAQRSAREWNCVVVLKGAPTIVAVPEGDVWLNPTGNAGLATGGSGDVLTGIVAALLGQGLSPGDAARLAVFLHGRAADRLRERLGVAGLLATDVIAELPATLLSLGGVETHETDPDFSPLPDMPKIANAWPDQGFPPR